MPAGPAPTMQTSVETVLPSGTSRASRSIRRYAPALRSRERAECLQHHVVVCLRRDLREDLGDRPVGCDHECGALITPVGAAVVLLLDPHAVAFGHLVLRIGDQD